MTPSWPLWAERLRHNYEALLDGAMDSLPNPDEASYCNELRETPAYARFFRAGKRLGHKAPHAQDAAAQHIVDTFLHTPFPGCAAEQRLRHQIGLLCAWDLERAHAPLGARLAQALHACPGVNLQQLPGEIVTTVPAAPTPLHKDWLTTTLLLLEGATCAPLALIAVAAGFAGDRDIPAYVWVAAAGLFPLLSCTRRSSAKRLRHGLDALVAAAQRAAGECAAEPCPTAHSPPPA